MFLSNIVFLDLINNLVTHFVYSKPHDADHLLEILYDIRAVFLHWHFKTIILTFVLINNLVTPYFLPYFELKFGRMQARLVKPW